MNSPLGSSGDVRLVQFPHPGLEHRMPTDGHRPWKLGNEDHARTFLQSRGTYRRAAHGKDREGELVFWGEWEGAVELITELQPVPEGPRWLCRPDTAVAAPVSEEGIPPQNTDPFVWGEAMRYTFCRQPSNGKLRRLGRGSVILFGSSVHHQFVLDTVLVVAGWIEHRHRDDLAGRTDAAYLRAAIEPMYGWGEGKRTYRLYFGATPREPVNGMFSFVPSHPAGGADSGFARPAIQLDDGLINGKTRMQARMLDVDAARIPEFWQSIVEAVIVKKLALATQLQLD
jgi:hypothetical protein